MLRVTHVQIFVKISLIGKKLLIFSSSICVLTHCAVVACSFHCGVTTNFIFILTIHISMDGSPGDVSEEPVT